MLRAQALFGSCWQGLWSTDLFNTSVWVESLGALAHRYRDQPMVVGMDIRNEARATHQTRAGYRATEGR